MSAAAVLDAAGRIHSVQLYDRLKLEPQLIDLLPVPVLPGDVSHILVEVFAIEVIQKIAIKIILLVNQVELVIIVIDVQAADGHF